jgi:hypothetical protein
MAGTMVLRSLTSTVQREKDNIVRFGFNYKIF